MSDKKRKLSDAKKSNKKQKLNDILSPELQAELGIKDE
jgi:hypothetical protein